MADRGASCSRSHPNCGKRRGDLGYFLARRGITVKSLDLLIAAYALSHGVAVLATDGDFAAMSRAGLRLLLVEP